MLNDRLIRASIALVWLYQGLWCKVLGGAPHHEAVMSAALGCLAQPALLALGLLECGIAAWVWWGARMRGAALVQTSLLAGMNASGLIWARHLIPDPAGMVVQNIAFVVLIWTASEDRRYVAH